MAVGTKSQETIIENIVLESVNERNIALAAIQALLAIQLNSYYLAPEYRTS